MSPTETLQQAHHLIDHMDPSQVPAVVAFIESMLDPANRTIANAPYDDEPETEEERLAVAASKKQHREHPELSSTFEEVLEEFGFVMNADGSLSDSLALHVTSAEKAA